MALSLSFSLSLEEPEEEELHPSRFSTVGAHVVVDGSRE